MCICESMCTCVRVHVCESMRACVRVHVYKCMCAIPCVQVCEPMGASSWVLAQRDSKCVFRCEHQGMHECMQAVAQSCTESWVCG